MTKIKVNNVFTPAFYRSRKPSPGTDSVYTTPVKRSTSISSGSTGILQITTPYKSPRINEERLKVVRDAIKKYAQSKKRFFTC